MLYYNQSSHDIVNKINLIATSYEQDERELLSFVTVQAEGGYMLHSAGAIFRTNKNCCTIQTIGAIIRTFMHG